MSPPPLTFAAMLGRVRLFIMLGVISLWISGCQRQADIPYYLQLQSFYLDADTTLQGTKRQLFQDVWVFVNGNLQGVYELPAKFPVIGEGNQQITLFPGIKVNGLHGERSAYPMTKALDTLISVEPNKTYTLTGKSVYYPGINIHWIENFEGAGFSLKGSGMNNVDTLISSGQVDSAFEGKSGFWKMEPGKFLEFANRDALKLPGGGVETFMEFHYRGSAPFAVGFYQETALGGIVKYPSIVTFYPSLTWKKAYLRCTDEITAQMTSHAGTTGFKMFFTSLNSSDKDLYLWVDNIKMLSR